MIKQHDIPKYQNKKLTWNNNWISTFESPWGILEKLKYANYLSAKDIFRLLGNEKVQKLKSGIGEVHRNLLTLQGFDDEAVKSVLGFSIHDHNQFLLQKIFQGFYNFSEKPSFYFRKDLFLCTECIAHGYHSLFFQLKLIQHCPFHGNPLTRGCSKCNDSIPYLFTDCYTEEPFLCKCGHLWLSPNNASRPISQWKHIKNDNIQSETLKKWINLGKNEISLLKRCRFFTGVDLENTTGVMDHLLSIVEHNSQSTSSHIHHKIVTANYINSLKINIQNLRNNSSNLKKINCNEFEESWVLLQSDSKYKYYYDHIYDSSRKTVNSVARQVRKFIYPKHKTCVKRLVKLLKEKEQPFPPVCPYAYAYIFWKKSIDGIEHFYKVDNFGYPYRRYTKSVDVASYWDRDYMHDFIDDWIDYYKVIKKTQLVGLKWILNRMIAILVLNHYENWFRIAPKYAAKREEANFKEYQYHNLPFFTFIFPAKQFDPIEFHWWEPRDNTNVNKDLKCPFPTVRQKRIKPSEKNHTPPKLLLNKFDRV
ncbi:MAG: hypothetical protein LPK26_01720 [Bacillaceae bacterium]|nr:hypothetical protein [Bacillaceae bacterium]